LTDADGLVFGRQIVGGTDDRDRDIILRGDGEEGLPCLDDVNREPT
jgi:hypothetical protein